MKWSNYQQNIFNDVKNGSGNTIVQALAGSAKTTTLIESLKYLDSDDTWILAAFNKNIANELREKAPKTKNGQINTLHSFGLKSLGSSIKNITVDVNKVEKILDLSLKEFKDDKELKFSITKAVSLAKSYLANTSQEIDNVLDKHDVVPDDFDREKFINHVLFTLDICKRKSNLVDMDDMVWLNCVLKTSPPKFDKIFVDEFQDLSVSQIEFILKMRKKNSRVFVFGDPLQSCYSWRGADENSMQRFQKALDAKILPLSITYRCPIAVVKKVHNLVPELEAAPNAIQGSVKEIDYVEMFKLAKPGCFILSRVNAPLIKIALQFLKNNLPCNIQGRDLGENLISLVNRSKSKTIEKFILYIEKWRKKETGRLLNNKKSTSIIEDKAECLLALTEDCESMQDLKNKLNKLFADSNDRNKIILSSIHRAKGMERDTVFVLKNTLRYNEQEEKNLVYISFTRSKQDLYLVSDKNKSK